MKTHPALLLALTLALIGAPAYAQNNHGHDAATAVPQGGPAMMNDVRSAMQTMMADPVISKRMNELMSTNPTFKKHVEGMRGMMPPGTGMMNGGGVTRHPMMSVTASPKP
jgi:hypothetical protein